VDFSGAAWRKSSYSGQGNNDACVEVTWRKSSHSGQGGNDACVEISLSPLAVGVRDSKNPAAHLIFAPPIWEALTSAMRRG
jgi:hypothetical protein